MPILKTHLDCGHLGQEVPAQVDYEWSNEAPQIFSVDVKLCIWEPMTKQHELCWCDIDLDYLDMNELTNTLKDQMLEEENRQRAIDGDYDEPDLSHMFRRGE